MKRSVNFSRTRKSRNVTNDIIAFLQDVGITSEMLRAESKFTPKSDCEICNGDGYYYEDVVGDGGTQERIICECVGDVVLGGTK